MKIIADLHLHSKYSRAVSQRMEPETIAQWAIRKGIDLIGTGDWTHPLWLKELEASLEEVEEGIFRLKGSLRSSAQNFFSSLAKPSRVKAQTNRARIKSDQQYSQRRDAVNAKKEKFWQTSREPKFILSTEISSIYSQGGKLRRIHNLLIAPSFTTVSKINEELKSRGCNLMSDGRPIIGLSSQQLCELVWSIDESVLVIPAHCLSPQEVLHTKKGIKRIDKIKVGDLVFTHKNRWQKVREVFSRLFKGEIYQIIPDYFRLGITVTEEHPFYAIKTKKYCPSINKNFGICKPVCAQAQKWCARQYFKNYQPEWIQARYLERGDVLLFPRFTKTEDKKFIKLTDYVEGFTKEGKGLISAGGFRRHKVPNEVKINTDFCRLAGYYLAEGYTSRDLISFCFSESEKEVLEEIKDIVKRLFGIKYFKEYKRKNYKGIELTFYSKTLYQFFSNFFYQDNNKRANNKCLPAWVLELPLEKQKEILIGWWQGDKGYTTSRLLMNQMKVICLRLGIIPSIGIDTKEAHARRGKHNKFENRLIEARHSAYHFSNLSFFEDKFRLLDLLIFTKFKTKLKRKRGWIDRNYIYLPIRKIIKKDHQGKVYNLEVEKDNSYTGEFALVHNCWTPWFSLYGSKSGFDSIEECFGEFSNRIYAVETGLSSDPGMNWRIKELENRSIVSFSDAHSPPKLGREATVFKIRSKIKDQRSKIFSFKDLAEAIKQDEDSIWEIAYTIEFYPEEGKYHFTGHRNCGVKQTPEETFKKGSTCPVCGKPLTVGVMHRVEELSNCQIVKLSKKNKTGLLGYYNADDSKRPPYVMLVPLMEILAEALNTSVTSQKVIFEYKNLTENLASEFDILMNVNLDKIAQFAGDKVAESIKKVRSGDIVVDPGYDGVFGVVKIWPAYAEATTGKPSLFNSQDKKEQMSLF